MGIAESYKPVVQALVSDERVAVLHMTGSTATYNAIVWGNPKGPTGGPRLVSKPFEAELGYEHTPIQPSHVLEFRCFVC